MIVELILIYYVEKIVKDWQYQTERIKLVWFKVLGEGLNSERKGT